MATPTVTNPSTATSTSTSSSSYSTSASSDPHSSFRSCPSNSVLSTSPLAFSTSHSLIASTAPFLLPSVSSMATASQNFKTISTGSHEERRASRAEQLWEEFFSDPSRWLDYRSDKRNPRFPDFKHKTADKALWIDNRFNPPWLHAKLGAMLQDQEQMQSEFLTHEIAGRVKKQEQLWLRFFSDPSQWWDNRFIKRSPKFPDFKHKITHEGLWIESWMSPPWIKAKMATTGLGQIQSFGRFTSRFPYSLSDSGNLSKLLQEGQLKDTLHMVELMVQQNVKVPINFYDSLLKGCTRRKALEEGKRVHALITSAGVDSSIFLRNNLVEMYAKCGSVLDAREVFNNMPEHNVFSWTAIISAYADHGTGEEAIELFQQMQQIGIVPDKVVFLIVLKACARISALEQGKHLHSQIIESGYESDVIIQNTLVGMYSKCGCIQEASRVFDKMSERDVVSWNVLITGYEQQGLGQEAVALYEQMKEQHVQPNAATYVALLKACARIAALEQGRQLHSDIITSGFESDIFVENTLIDMYAKCGCMENAFEVFIKMNHPDVVSWTALIAGYDHQGLGKEALDLYHKMKQKCVQPNATTFVVVLKACARIAALDQGRQLHLDIRISGFESDLVVQNTLIDMYAKCGCLEYAHEVFNKMSTKSVVSWTAMIAGYVQQGLGKEALLLYEHMKREGVQPDNTTYVVLLKGCALISSLEQGKIIHSHTIKSGVEMDAYVAGALVDMYAKCGCIEDAYEVFIKMNKRSVVTWNAMITGYAQQGFGKKALKLLAQMQREGIKPNEVTFVSVLSACSHSGLVNEAHYFFNSMYEDHGITPTSDHYASMVDLLGRAGRLADAEDFINKMPMQPDAVVWAALLSAARNHGHVELGRHAFDSIVKLGP